MRKSIRNDLSVGIGIIVLSISLTIGTVYYIVSAKMAEDEYKSHISIQTENIAKAISLQLWLFDLNTTRELCELLLSSEPISGIKLLDHNNEVIFDQTGVDDSGIIKISRELFYEGDKTVGHMDLFFSNGSWVQQKDRALTLGVLLILGAVIPFYFLTKFLLRKYLSQPLEKLQGDMNALAHGEFKGSDLSEQREEVQNIIDAFNNLVRKLRSRDQQVSQKALSLVKEIADRKQAESAVRESQRTLVTVLDSIDARIYVSDLENHQILFMNKFMKDHYKGNGLNEKCYQVLRKKEAPCDFCNNDRLLDKSGNSTGVHVWEERDSETGSWFIKYARAVKWHDGRFVRLQISTDITKIKELEKELFQSQKLESIGNLAGGIAHEFNNVLSIILGSAELAMDDVPDSNPAKESLKEIRTASFRAKDVVSQILSFARKTMTELKPLEINTIAKESLKLMRASIPTMIDIQPSIPSDPMMILGDPTEIHQIIINLCTNASHAMKAGGGKLEVDISEIYLDKEGAAHYEDLEPGYSVKLTVKDSGEGIPPDILEQVFDPYFTTKEFGEGSGMGLAVVYGIIKKCKGDIKIESIVGEGTTVDVLFPRIEEVQAEERKEGELPKGNERILLVDDDPSIVNMTRQMLERMGYTVTGMTDSVAALEQFQSAHDDFDLVITDMAMPNMSGDQLAAGLIEVRNDVPILLCTGYSDTVDEKKAKQLGIKGFAMKPLDKGQLARAVRAVLDKNNDDA